MNNYEESCLVFAARYAHTRNTGAANMVVSTILSKWDELSKDTKNQLIREAKEATCNYEDWERLIKKEA